MKQTLNALQGLRVCAAMLVVVAHSVEIIEQKGGAAPTPELLNLDKLLAHGTLGVAVFFVISGFVMMYAHGNDFGVPGTPNRFANRRIGRIAPLYWTVTLIYAVWLAIGHRAPHIANVAQSVAFLPLISNGEKFGWPVLGQGWTLNYEAFFYFIFGISLFFKRGLALVFVTVAALVAAHLAGGFGHDNPIAYWSDPWTLYFLAGLGLGALRLRFRLPFGFYSAVAVALSILAVEIFLKIKFDQTLFEQIIRPVLVVSMVAACVLASEQEIGRVPRIVAKSIGDTSYSIYLTHTLIISIVVKTLAGRTHMQPMVEIVLLVSIGLSFGMAVHYALEKRLIDAWARLFGRGRVAGPSAPLAPLPRAHSTLVTPAAR